MNLARELEPRWVHPNVFVFLCPHCKSILLSCKNINMSHTEQRELFERVFGEDACTLVVFDQDDQCWSISGSVPRDPNATFPADLTVTPSIDASKSGHWHGFITNGECSP